MKSHEHSNNEYENKTPMPNPDLTPEEVISIQLEALKNNDRNDAGLETAFHFVAPANRPYIGPLNRFREIVRKGYYGVMLNHRSARFEPITISGDIAQRRVMVIGKNAQMVMYTFVLSKQRDPQYRDCWMTDVVTIDAVLSLN